MRTVLMTVAAAFILLPSLSAQSRDVDTVRIPSGGTVMFGSLFRADGPGPHPTVILLHGSGWAPVYGQGAASNVLELAQPLRAAGFATLVFNYRGAYGSGGSYGVINQIDDVKAALDLVRARAARYGTDPTRVTLVGHSVGGLDALLTAVDEPRVSCTVAIAPPDSRVEIQRIRDGNLVNTPAADSAVPGLSGRTIGDLQREMIANEGRLDAIAHMGAFKNRPLLIVSGSQDQTVPPEQIQDYVDAAQASGARPFAHVEIDADHVFTLDGNRDELANVVVSWMTEHCR